MSAEIMCLSEYRAKKQVREQLRRHGVKISSMSARDLNLLSRMSLDIHRDELVAGAFQMVGSSPELQKMYEKEQRQRAKLSINVQTRKPCFDKTISVQMSGAAK